MGVLSCRKACFITQHRSRLPRAPRKRVLLLPTATQSTRCAERGGFSQEPSFCAISFFAQKPQGSVYKGISYNNLLFNTWNFLAAKDLLFFFLNLKNKEGTNKLQWGRGDDSLCLDPAAIHCVTEVCSPY